MTIYIANKKHNVQRYYNVLFIKVNNIFINPIYFKNVSPIGIVGFETNKYYDLLK